VNPLVVIKIGGNIVDKEQALQAFLSEYASLPMPKILVHGGGKLATKMAADLHIPQTMIDGRRITDGPTLDVVTMVYAGLINKKIVAYLQSLGCNALGLTGTDANSILAHKRIHPTIDYGFAGDIDEVNISTLRLFLENNIFPVFAPITHNGNGQLLNTNADTIAQSLAVACSKNYAVTLVYGFEKAGVLENVEDENSVISKLQPKAYAQLKSEKKIFEGMIPKLDNAFNALHDGVEKVIIGKAENIRELILGKSGTTITHE